MKDILDRKKCLDPSKSFVVKASAGTGKTHETVNRILSLLAQACTKPEEILAITFTVDAAEELRSRVIDALKKSQDTNGEISDHAKDQNDMALRVMAKDAKYEWNLIENSDRLNVMTFDSFFQFACKDLGDAAGMGSDLTISDNPERIYNITIDAVLKDAWEGGNEWSSSIANVWRSFDGRETTVRNMMKHMLAIRDQWVSAMGNDLPEVGNTYINAIQEECLASLSEEGLIKCVEVINGLYKMNSISLDPRLTIFMNGYQNVTDIASWKALSEWLMTKDGNFKKRGTKKEGFPSKVLKTEKEQLKFLKDEFAEIGVVFSDGVSQDAMRFIALIDNQDDIFLNDVMMLLKILVAQLRITMEHLGEYDFTEFAMRGLSVLGLPETPSEMLLKLDYQIRHILVDEAQDTSNLQLNALRMLTSGWTQDDGRTIFAVGDFKQGVYNFRGANAIIFDILEKQGINGIKLEPINLSTNFRSKPAIVNWVDDKFKDIFPKKSLSFLHGFEHKASYAFDQSTSDEYFVNLALVEGEDCEAANKQEAIYVAKTIANIQKTKPEDSIAILSKNRSVFSGVIDQLVVNDVDFKGINIDQLQSSLDVSWLCSIYDILTSPMNWKAWVTLLHSPLIGLSFSEIESVQGFIDENTSILAGLKKGRELNLLSIDITECVNVMGWALNERHRSSRLKVIKRTWQRLHGLNIAKENNALSKVDKVFSIIKSLENKNQLSAYSLFKMLEGTFGDRDNKTENPVEMMTIHRSKGQEFDHVFIVGGTNGGRGNSLPLLSIDNLEHPAGTGVLIAAKQASGKQTSNYTMISEIEKGRSRYEAQRLFYVAATRAKKTLTIIGKQLEGGNIYCKPNSLLSGSMEVLMKDFKFIDFDTSANNEKKKEHKIKRFTSNHNWETALSGYNAPALTNDVNYEDVKFASTPANTIFGEIGHKILEISQVNSMKTDAEWLESIRHVFFRFGVPELYEANKVRCLGIAKWAQTSDIASKIYQNIDWSESEVSLISRDVDSGMNRLDYCFEKGSEFWIIDFKFPSMMLTPNEIDNTYGAIMNKYKKLAEKNNYQNVKLAVVQPEYDNLTILN